MNQWNKVCFGSLSLFFAFSSLYAVQIDPEIIQLIKESNVRIVEEPSSEEIIRDLINDQQEERAGVIAKCEQPLKTFDTAEGDEEEVINGCGISIEDYYTTTHPAAFHYPINKSENGKTLELEDKSIWEVHPGDASKVKLWKPNHILAIAPNKNIFSRWSYKYKIVNLDTRDTIKVSMTLTPVFNDPNIDTHVHWIEEIDYESRHLRLEDGSLWDISYWDKSDIKSFERYNIVIIGTNDGWFRSSNPNILICVKNNKYIRGNVIGH